MNKLEIDTYLKRLDGRGSDREYEAVRKLKALGLEFPKLLLEKYRSSKKWGERASCVYHASKYAKSSQEAFDLAIEALADKSTKLRYQACLLLAISQKPAALPQLEILLENQESAADAKAAIDALIHKNQNYFVDRDRSGMVTLNVEQYRS